MALDARSRSSIDGKLVPLLGEEEANVLNAELPAVEADELVTEQFLRAELAELEAGLRTELHAEIGGLRNELHNELHRMTMRLGHALAACTAVLASIGFFA